MLCWLVELGKFWQEPLGDRSIDKSLASVINLDDFIMMMQTGRSDEMESLIILIAENSFKTVETHKAEIEDL